MGGSGEKEVARHFQGDEFGMIYLGTLFVWGKEEVMFEKVWEAEFEYYAGETSCQFVYIVGGILFVGGKVFL